jgi:hypothetical protein
MSNAPIRSLKDCALRSAGSADALLSSAQYALDNIPGFPEECPKEHRAELNTGWLLHYTATHEPVVYGKFGESWAPVKGDAKSAETVKVDATYAMSFTTHEFGRMADTHGASFKDVIGAVRKDYQTYESNRFGDLKRAAAKEDKRRRGVVQTRTPTKEWGVWVKEDWLPDLTARFKTAQSRGDKSADSAMLDKIRAAVTAALK